MEKSVNDYLISLLTKFESYIPSREDAQKIERNRAEFIAEKLTRKKFRRRKLAEKTRQGIFKKVQLSIEKSKPIHLVIPFGGYKHYWNKSYPEPDWAELFNFKYLTEFVSPAIAIYKPGVVVEYMSEDLIIEKMDNYPKEALETYSKRFKEILEWYNKQIPKNLTFRYFRVCERCDAQKILERIEKLLPERKKAFEKLSSEKKEEELRRSWRSVFWNGQRNLSNLNEKERQERVIESRLIELAYYETESRPEFMGKYLWEDNHICVCFSFGTTYDNDELQDLTLGSTYGSLVDFWIGRGVLEKRADEFFPRIISKNQYEELKGKINVLPVTGILPFKNYQQIELF